MLRLLRLFRLLRTVKIVRRVLSATGGRVALALWGGNVWWGAEASAYSRSVLYRPFNATASIDRHTLTLAIRDPRKARVEELRFFGGLSVDETATVLEVSPQTVLRDWSLSKTWLAREMSREAHE